MHFYRTSVGYFRPSQRQSRHGAQLARTDQLHSGPLNDSTLPSHDTVIMHYQFNNITGRLIGNQNFTPYFPIGASPLSKVESPRPVFATANQKVAVETVRASSSAPAKRIPGSSEFYAEVPAALRKRMELFQQKNGVPIHLKGGAGDRLLFGATIGLCVIGVAGVLLMIVDMSFPKKKK